MGFNIFQTKKDKDAAQNTNADTPMPNNSTKLGNETYRQWGHRMAGLNQGNTSALEPHLHIVVQTIKQEQASDQALQENLKQQTATQIAALQNQKAIAENEKVASDQKIRDLRQQIQDLNDELIAIRNQSQRPNRKARANFIIGLLILIPLTLYLFLFYSSTAYSAFFKVFSFGDDNLSKHMFDSGALAEAWATSWTTALFVLLITFVFMALGYVLHQFSNEKGGMKYFKSLAVVLVTFIFDTLMAFSICKNLYDMESLTMLESRPEYSMSLAAQDPNFWMVIFCGFVAYLIWGLMYGFIMTNYDLLDANGVARRVIEGSIKQAKSALQAEQQNYTNLANQIIGLSGQIDAMEIQKPTQVSYDLGKMKLELNHFLTGWTTYMSGASMPQVEIDKVNGILQDFCNTLSNNDKS